MPKITVAAGASNAREDDSSPSVVTSALPVVAADGREHSPDKEPVQDEESAVPAAGGVVESYEGMSLAELRAACDARGLPTYGRKDDLRVRLRESE